MKTLIILSAACMFSITVQAQFLGGFFSQKSEARKLLVQQIAALEVYKGYVKKGYDIASNGLGIINKIKSGDFDLHRDFFGALKKVNPKISKYSKVAELIVLNVASVKELTAVAKLSEGKLFSVWENRYIRQVIDQTTDIMAQTLDELIAIITDNQVQLKDDERIKRVDSLYDKAVEHYSFSRNLFREISMYKWFKDKEKADIDGIGELHGIVK